MRYWLLALFFMFVGCGEPDRAGESTAATSTEASKLVVYTVNYPLQYFAERIGGDHVDVVFPAPADGDPAFWSPDIAAVAAFQGADLILLNGANYAKWVDKVTLPTSKMISTSESFRDDYIIVEGVVTHSHGPGGEHSHGEAAFTTWLDPALAIAQAGAVHEAMTSARPERAAAFQQGLDALEADLNALNESLRGLVEGKNETPLLGSHPVYQYLARAYELDLVSVHFELDEVPEPEGWRELQHLLEDHPARWMLWEGDPLAETADKLRELGVESVVFDPCGNRPAAGDYLSIMQSNVANMERIFENP